MSRLNNSQVLILKAFAGKGSMTREEIAERAGVPASTSNLGPVFQETLPQHPDSLYARRLVTAALDEDNGKEIVLYSLTPQGKKAATEYAAKKRNGTAVIPPRVLDPIVKRIRALRTYAMERFTEEDLREIRKCLTKKYSEIPLEDLKQQIVNRRKQGAYTDRNACKLRSLKRVMREFGHEGTVIAGLLSGEQKQAIDNYARELSIASKN